jgi:hypothetical protein
MAGRKRIYEPPKKRGQRLDMTDNQSYIHQIMQYWRKRKYGQFKKVESRGRVYIEKVN